MQPLFSLANYYPHVKSHNHLGPVSSPIVSGSMSGVYLSVVPLTKLFLHNNNLRMVLYLPLFCIVRSNGRLFKSCDSSERLSKYREVSVWLRILLCSIDVPNEVVVVSASVCSPLRSLLRHPLLM